MQFRKFSIKKCESDGSNFSRATYEKINDESEESWSVMRCRLHAFISMGDGIDCTTPAGKLQLHVLAALSEFEKGRIQERVKADLARARGQGVRLGRPRRRLDPERVAEVAGLPERKAARRLGIPRSTFQRLRERQALH